MDVRGNVYLAGSDTPLHRSTRTLLQRAGYQVLDSVSEAQVDLLFAFVRTADEAGLQPVADLRAQTRAKLLAVIAREAIGLEATVLNGGADDFLLAPFDSTELLARIRGVMRQTATSVAAQQVIRVGPIEVDPTSRVVRRHGADIQLTGNEHRLLLELARHSGRVLTHKHLLYTLWGSQRLRDVGSLRAIVYALRRKLGLNEDEHPAISSEPRTGYQLVTTEHVNEKH